MSGSNPNGSKILELKNITKTFLGGKVIANNDVSIFFGENEVHSIVGENGSGKSTLMNILFGLYKQDSGSIYINGKLVNMFDSSSAKKYKIGMVHQHFHLIDNFTVLDNVLIGQEHLEKTREELKKINELKAERKDILLSLKEIASKEKDFAKKIDKVFKLKRKLIRELEKQNNLIHDAKVKIAREKRDKVISKIKNKNSKRYELIKSLNEGLDLISMFDNSSMTNEQKHYFELSERLAFVDSELEILDIKIIGLFFNLKRKKAIERLKKIQIKYNIHLDPYAKVNDLSIGQKQMVEILKVLWTEKNIIVFDEPTATLSVVEIESLMKTINSLKEEGKTIIFISHKINEVKEISDRVSVLRKGVLMGTYDNDAKLTPSMISKLMVGKTIELEYPRRKVNNKPVIKVEGLSYRTKDGFKAVNDISFEINEGEIFGLAGIEGNGQEEVLKIFTDLRKPSSGKIEYLHTKKDVKQWRVLTDKKGYKRHGVLKRTLMSHVPTDRQKYGIAPSESLEFNAKISDFDTGFLHEKNKRKTNPRILSEFTDDIINGMNVEGAFNHGVQIRNLSGGNQQKFVVGREVFRDHKILIAGHPTRGLDISAIDHIYQTMINNSTNKATLLYSLEINELLAVCDRVAVMYHGKIVKIIRPSEVSLEEVSRMMIGEVD